MSSQNSLFSQDSLDSQGDIHFCRSIEGLIEDKIGDHWEQQHFIDDLKARINRENTDPMDIYFIRRLANLLKQIADRADREAAEKASS